jgi:hypothetical protein
MYITLDFLLTLNDISEQNYPNILNALAVYIRQPGFPAALQRFVYTQCHPGYEDFPPILPEFLSKISVFHSATASFYAPSNLCGADSMHHEHIHANSSWKGSPWFDTTIVTVSDGNIEKEQVMHGMLVAHVLLLFSYHDPKLHKKSSLVHL